MRRQFGNQPLGKRLDDLFFLFGLGRLSADGDDGALAIRRERVVGDVVILWGIAVDGLGLFVLGTDPAAIDDKGAVLVDSDEGTGDGDLGGVIDSRTAFEDVELLLDLAEPVVDVVRQLVVLGIFSLETLLLLAQLLALPLLLLGQWREGAGDCAQPVIMAIGKFEVGVDPLPAFGRDLVGGDLQFLGDKAIEKRHIFQPAVLVIIEEVGRKHLATCRHIGIDTDEQRAFVGCGNGGFGQHAPDTRGLAIVRLLDSLPYLLLTGMIRMRGERLQHRQGHGILGIHVVQLWRDLGEREALIDITLAGEVGAGDFLGAHPAVDHALERLELIERMQREPECVFCQRVVGRRGLGVGLLDDAGDKAIGGGKRPASARRAIDL